MICTAAEILGLVKEEPFAGEPHGPKIVRSVGVLAKRPRALPALPIHLPAGEDWLARIGAIRHRFALGVYRRAMRTIACLGQVEKRLGGAVTIRNSKTFERIIEQLKSAAASA